MAGALGIQLHTVESEGSSWRRDLVETVVHAEYPLTHESSVPMSQIVGLARDRGVKVLLSGDGADELLGGFEWMNAVEHRRFALRHDPARRAVVRGRAAARRLVRGRPVDLRGEPAPAVAQFEADLAHRAQHAYSHHQGARRALEAICLGLLETYLPHLLNRQDKNTMRCSVETRVPFLDPAVVALSLNLPLARVEPRRKEILRELADEHLPPGVGDRPKIGFGFDVRRYLDGHTRQDFLLDGRCASFGRLPRSGGRRACRRLTLTAPPSVLERRDLGRGMLDGQGREAIESALWQAG